MLFIFEWGFRPVLRACPSPRGPSFIEEKTAMYSVVLATMLTAGAENTAWCHRAWCHGCHGCHYNAFSRCHGCHSYCSGWYCSGCWCSGSWCHGCHISYGCHYSYGCHCSGVVVGCHYSHGCYSSSVVVRDVVRERRADGPQNDAERKAVEDLLRRMREQRKPDRERERDQETSTDTARVVVRLPERARLWVDQVPCPLTGSERAFDTPALESGQRYYYTLRVEVERDGRQLEESRRVTVTAGQRVEVDFNNVGAVRTAQNRRRDPGCGGNLS